ncbi:MAG: hypothetical protein K2Z81_26565, partial [Cyanobacteria bacterium]|nr:hypothetical protein [Cyanobacteriota bacterium]
TNLQDGLFMPCFIDLYAVLIHAFREFTLDIGMDRIVVLISVSPLTTQSFAMATDALLTRWQRYGELKKDLS